MILENTKKARAKKRPADPSASGAVKALCDILRRAGCADALQAVPELTWIFFLRVLDEREARDADEAAARGLPFVLER